MKGIGKVRLVATLLLSAGLLSHAQKTPDATVVMLDDTSLSMKQNDPENAIVLVTRLFADLVPGKLGVVRLIDLGNDVNDMNVQKTGQSGPCPDDPKITCFNINLPPDASAQFVKKQTLIQIRNARGDAAFKQNLKQLLAPAAASTLYNYSFATVDDYFQKNPATTPDGERLVVWLSDGAADAEPGDWQEDADVIKKLRDAGVAIKPLVFQNGNTQKLDALGLPSSRVQGNPKDLMKAFADVFRAVVQAPWAVDGDVARNPTFEIKPRMQEVWVVIYGDESLSGASVTMGGQTVEANYAADHDRVETHPIGHAYRVAHFLNPAAGSWTVHAQGGGSDVSYAVIQRSTMTLFIYPTSEVIPGVPFQLTASIRDNDSADDLRAADLPEPITIDAIVGGQTVTLTADPSHDGRYTGLLTVQDAGPFTVTVHAHNHLLDRTKKVDLEAHGFFRYSGGPLTVDFGSLKAGDTICRDLSFLVEQKGVIPFELRSVTSLPSGLDLLLKTDKTSARAGGGMVLALPEDRKQICLVTQRNAKASVSSQQNWVTLGIKGRTDEGSAIELRMNWSMRELTFWERWGRLIVWILVGLLLWTILYGYIKPHRFRPGLALCFAPEIADLDDQTPYPVRKGKGVGIGFYRDARACLRENYRVTGQVKNAVAILQAGPVRSVIVKGASRPIFRESASNEWEQLPETGRRAAMGEIYRVGESGPFFRLSTRMTS